MSNITTQRYQFHRSQGDTALGAFRLARATAWAGRQSMAFSWETDEHADHSWCEEKGAHTHEVLGCVAIVGGHVVASLWGIFDPDTNYRRSVEAELALEAYSAEQERRRALTERYASWTRVCNRAIEQALGSNFPVGQCPYIADPAVRDDVYRADAIRHAFADIVNGDWLYAFRGLLYAKHVHGRCPGGGPYIADAIAALQCEVEDKFRTAEGVR